MVANPHAPAGATSGGGVYSDFRSGGNPEPGNGPGSGTPSGGPGATASPSGGSSPVPTAGAVGYSLLYNDYATADEIARSTGGHAIYSNNDVKGALAEVTEAGANYYTLSYSPTNQNYDGKLRNIRVELAKRGYQLAYRHSYVGADPNLPVQPVKSTLSESPQPESRKPGDLLYANMQYGAPM